ncbi:tetratricopeptide repeat-containing sulfotransferase family protein [Gloeobacter kilaueensis]|uniref:Sulfotransferase n=1 Tax=Gloeobacter kilaueensis (strain ATCC BAA-2537 / CCAP 1431/1 / ULC 316 / JS1) TaxID=1183438 RepID=U5QIR5_GLOK1|nr:tetratricopeptide repeat-containing sulfotransferase family protein [Gloeobacter kilaueensis]AGY58783.1 sulfotransferase [Gloeobacter kilaueensis JS1]
MAAKERAGASGRDSSALLHQGRLHRQQDRLSEAIHCFRQAIKQDGSLVEAHLQLAGTLAQQGQLQAAAASFEQVIRLEPDCGEAFNELAALYVQLGAPDRAIAVLRRLLAVRHDHLEAHLALAALLEGTGDLQGASACYRQALLYQPGSAPAQFGLALLLHKLGHLSEARTHYLKVAELDSHSALARARLGQIEQQLDQPEAALGWFDAALAVAPEEPVFLGNLALAFENLGELDKAQKLYERVLDLKPTDPTATAGLASVREKRRDYRGAYELLAPLARPESADLRVALSWAVVCSRLAQPAEALPVLGAVLDRVHGAQERALVLFRLADLYDALGKYDEAFGCLEEAHALQPFFFDPAAWTGQIDRLIATFSAENLANLPRASNRSPLPVFIVGMPRSGSSLIEQILSRHSSLFAAGERTAFFNLAGTIKNYPASTATLTQGALDALAEPYLAQLQQLAPAASRITDKLPQNYLHLGLISRLFPAARIIHCRRDPLDTCLSCYFQNFAARHPYTSRLEQLGQYYRQYERLMAHWQQGLPVPMLEVWYEELVAQQERVSRRLVEFLELQWEEECLSFWRSERLVNTASYDQVRRPLYDRSVGRARHYARHLELLQAILERNPSR